MSTIFSHVDIMKNIEETQREIDKRNTKIHERILSDITLSINEYILEKIKNGTKIDESLVFNIVLFGNSGANVYTLDYLVYDPENDEYTLKNFSKNSNTIPVKTYSFDQHTKQHECSLPVSLEKMGYMFCVEEKSINIRSFNGSCLVKSTLLTFTFPTKQFGL